jgi:hypothetical protein
MRHVISCAILLLSVIWVLLLCMWIHISITTSSFVYKACMQFKINFDHKLTPTNYELYSIKIISLETSFVYESNDINFMIYISFFIGKN